MTKPKKKTINMAQQKYVDDMTQCAAVNLKNLVLPDPNPTKDLPCSMKELGIYSLQTSTQFKLKLINSKLMQKRIKWSLMNQRPKVMLFNSAKKIDILPKIELTEGTSIEVVDEAKLLGLIIRSDLKWHSNTENIIRKSYTRMWILRNLKRFGAEEQELVDTYIQQIRSITEMACPAWNGGLTQQEQRGLERIQRTAMAIIRGDKHTTYQEALDHFGMDKLEVRRETLCLKFALKAYRNPKFTKWFAPNTPEVNTRSIQLPLKEIRFRTSRFKSSPIPYLTRLLNNHLTKHVH